MVSHDLRNPLGVVTMGTAFLRELVPADDAQIGRQLDMIGRSAEHMNRMIEDLLDVAAWTPGGSRRSSRPYPRRRCCAGAELLVPMAGAGGITRSWRASFRRCWRTMAAYSR